MNVKLFTFYIFLWLVQSNGKEVYITGKEVDGSYTRKDKVKHLAALNPINERTYELNFLDMVFEIIVDLPSHIQGLKPFLFCPEILLTLFLNDINNIMYQCDAPGITSNTVTLVCQELKDVKSVTCVDRHQRFMPAFLKQFNSSNVSQTANTNDNNNYLTVLVAVLIILIIILIPLLAWSIYLHQKSAKLLNNSNDPPPQNPLPPFVFNQQNGVEIPYASLPQNEDDDIQQSFSYPEPNSSLNENTLVSVASSDGHDSTDAPNTTNEEDEETVSENNVLTKAFSSDDEVKCPCEPLPKSLKKLTNNEKTSSSPIPSENEEELNKSDSMSSLEILTDEEDDEWVQNEKPKKEGLISRTFSLNSRLSKLYGNDLFTKASHIVIFDENDVIAFNTHTKQLSKFPAATDYSFYPPKMGVNYESSTVIKPNINEKNLKSNLANFNENSLKSCLLPLKECYTSHGIQQFYVIEIDKKERLIQAETVVIDLIRKASKPQNSKDTVAFIIPAYFSEKQKNVILHAAHTSDFWSLELVDEQLALGYSITKVGKKYFILVNCYETKSVISMFRKEIELIRKCVEIDDIEKSGKDIGQIVEAINLMLKEKNHSEISVFVSRNKNIFAALKQFYFENSNLSFKFFEKPEEMLVKGETPEFLPLRL